jgi:copper(I)-binding protein
MIGRQSADSRPGTPASLSPVNLRRILAAGTVGLVATAVLTACGFDYPTDRISNLTVGTDYRDGNVSVLNAVVVSTAGNGGTLIATLVNNTAEDQQVTGITGTGKVTSVEMSPLTIKPNSLVNLANEGGYAVSGTFGVGDVVDLTFAFGDGTTAPMEVPVVADVGEWAGLDTATPSAAPSASAGS